ncbi:hypothetical protein NQZ68_036359 [Dissostichus eleginoides]|nr:hypothetical protein NQZ68_036359 [Dissostichus eleginoides]
MKEVFCQFFDYRVTVKRPVSPWGELLGKHLGVNKTTSDNMLMGRFIIPPPTSSASPETPQISNISITRLGSTLHSAAPPFPAA